ncbi:uncharacterized protein I303_100650 [Kwoniella dejecticola CBS 10117]|uniref:GH18 domain-containing protein n=1 Tax=Kwoniella dejecticola CBS 10117 TaxID=1296121 RepID=A0A1A6AFI4_9TREE|nr:uncharacterized protein I303_00654 [Kwoniella dejecticola CBS 10117]OBR88837.1 hypothetical protein I303_00654 [Kwoniella dejecticola CBS 10117]
MRTVHQSALVALFGALNVLALPAALPQTAADPAAAVSASGGISSSSTTGFTYTCQNDKQWTDSSGNTNPCQGDTVCKEGVDGGPCVWPEGYGVVALAETGASVPAASVPSAAAGPVGASSAGGSAPLGVASSSAGGAVPSAPAGYAASSATPVAAPSGSQASPAAGGAVPQASSALAASSAASAPGASGTASSSSSANTTSTTSGNSTTGSNSTVGGSGSSAKSGGTNFVGYWDNYANLGGIQASQVDGLTHIILSFVDMETWTTSTSSFAQSSNGNFDATTPDTLKGMNSRLKVTAALGGWGLDQAIKTAADGGETAIAALIENAKGVVKQWNLDGLDLDWEFPTSAQQPAFVSMVQGLKKGIQEVKSDGILSVAIGSRTTQKDPKTGHSDVEALTSETFSALNDVVDMWNVMTYDYLNRYDTKTTHQGGGVVVEQTLKYYEGVGIDLSKVNIGFLNTAKFFRKVDSCSASEPIGCPLGGVNTYETGGEDNGESGWLRYNPEMDEGLGDIAKKVTTQVRPQFEARPDDSQTAFEAEKAHAWYDETNKVFWTWTSPEDNKAVCEEWKSKVGGMMVWSLNQDENGQAGGSHMKALVECVKGA